MPNGYLTRCVLTPYSEILVVCDTHNSGPTIRFEIHYAKGLDNGNSISSSSTIKVILHSTKLTTFLVFNAITACLQFPIIGTRIPRYILSICLPLIFVELTMMHLTWFSKPLSQCPLGHLTQFASLSHSILVHEIASAACTLKSNGSKKHKNILKYLILLVVLLKTELIYLHLIHSKLKVTVTFC